MGCGATRISPTGIDSKQNEAESDGNVHDKPNKAPSALHTASKIGDVNALLHCLLRDNADPWQLDDFDNIPVYYSSLNGHELCCALLLIKMGGAAALTPEDRDRCATNAQNMQIKALFSSDATTQSMSQTLPAQIAELINIIYVYDRCDK